METYKGLVLKAFVDQAAWTTWLEAHHEQQEGLWLKFAKKGTGIASITYEDARESAIIYGWIDGLRNGFDEHFYLLRFTPRRARSKWSKINRGIAAQLIDEQRMKPAGMREVMAAKQDGRWDAAYSAQSKMEVPQDFQEVLNSHPEAKTRFETLSASNRYSVLYRIADAKKPETRQRRIKQAIEMLEREG